MKHPLLLLVPLLAAGLPISGQADNESDTQQLLRRIEALEADLAAAKKRDMRAAEVPQWKTRSNWRALERGMSEQRVTDLLGEPGKITVIDSTYTYWYWGYPSGGSAHFKDRALDTWSEP